MPGNGEVVDCHVRNLNPLIPFSIKWTVENVFRLPRGSSVTSPDIHPHPFTTWNLRTSYVNREKTLVSVWLCNESVSEARVQGSASMSDSDHKLINKVDLDFDLSGEVHEMLLLYLDSDAHGGSSQIHLFFQLKIYGLQMQKRSCSYKYLPKEDQFLDAMKSDLQSLRRSARFSDVKLIAEGKPIPAHKLILCARSPVFAKMFEHPTTTENTANRVIIPDIPFGILDLFLDFLYANFFPDLRDVDTAYSLYYAADKYQVMDLRRACGQALLDKVTTDDACRLLDLADCHHDEELMEEATGFIEFHFASVAGTDGWKWLLRTNPKAATYVLNHLSRDHSK